MRILLRFLLSIFVVYVPTFGMLFPQLQIENKYSLQELRTNFNDILANQPLFIQLDLNDADSFTKPASGIYKFIPSYQKINFTPNEIRFIIQKHIITGQWQLTEFDPLSYPFSKNMQAFTVMEEIEISALNYRTSIMKKMQKSNKSWNIKIIH